MMSGDRLERYRHALPAGSTVRRRLDYAHGEGTSHQPRREPVPRVTVVSTPRKHEFAIRNIRRNVRGMRDNEIDDYLRELEVLDLERERDPGHDSDLEDISPAEDSGEEYRPPGVEREESELEFSGFSAFDDEDDLSYDNSDSDGDSEGDGPVPRRGRIVRRRRGGAQRRARDAGVEVRSGGEVHIEGEGEVQSGDEEVRVRGEWGC